ncbi:hypothetical protein SOM26_05700 [Sphingomonas sp. CFBP8993]|uniref:hypothetical protein n=1 Tax=Sphingomonas sp. CFBP8993 TaxID=3096526 RepID=UPI002A6B7FB3|nr:hypothetical protein [Sphingomonas sp. CFBP8993]MDY0958176.1 hypothetical protein [Sphingomonas sp. CFBP8993]
MMMFEWSAGRPSPLLHGDVTSMAHVVSRMVSGRPPCALPTGQMPAQPSDDARHADRGRRNSASSGGLARRLNQSESPGWLQAAIWVETPSFQDFHKTGHNRARRTRLAYEFIGRLVKLNALSSIGQPGVTAG